MKKILLVLLIVFALAFTFAACEPAHEHTFSNEWRGDETGHWHKATCEHTDLVDGKAPHDMQAIAIDKTIAECTICGYKTATQHEHTFEANYSADENGHSRKTTCGCVYVDFAHHNFVNGVCDTCGWWSNTTDVMLGQLSKLNAWDYTLLLDNVTVNNVDALSEDAEHDSITVSGELKLSVTADGQIKGEGYFETASITVKAVVSDGTVYACGNDKYIRCTLDELLAQLDVNVEQIKAYVDELNANTQNMREYVEQAQQYLKMLPVDGDTVKQLLANLVKQDNANSTDKLTAYVLDTDVLRQLNDVLASTTVQGYVDSVFGEGFFAELPNYVESLFDVRIGKILLDLQVKYGVSLDDIITMANSVIEQYYPDKDVNTVDGLLAAMGVDLKGVPVKQWIELSSVLTLGTALETLQRNSENPVTAADIVSYIDSFCKAYGDKTLYQIAVANNAEYTAEDVEQLVSQSIDALDECLTVEFYIDANGVLQQVEFVVTETENVDGQAANQLQQLLAGINGTILLQRDYVTEQDYSQVIEQVNQYYNSLEQAAA